VEDVITTGQSTIDAILAARDFGLDIVKVIALIDREESDGRQNIEKLGMPCESIFTVRDFS
jgi:orotate phosphoribosyltransferase